MRVEEEGLFSILQERGIKAQHIDSMTGGGNNRIYRVRADGDQLYAVKRYSSYEQVTHERMQREFAALTWMEQCQFQCVPKPICCDKKHRIMVSSWEPGKRPEGASSQSIDQLVQYLAALHANSRKNGVPNFDSAKDACLSADAVLELLESRIQRLHSVSEEHTQVRNFIQFQCVALKNQLTDRLKSLYADAGLDVAQLISLQQRTLSPSDYGFHNALADDDGKLTFIDFEYFGWDDPVKMVSDFLWHPGQQLNSALKLQFKRAMSSLFSGDALFSVRMEALFPLYGLIWVLIVLNNFIPDVWESKLTSGLVKGDDKQVILQQQFEKASSLFNQVREYVMTVETV